MENRFPLQTNQHLDDQKSKLEKPASPSPLSSPSHEFSFTITLHPSPDNTTPTTFKPKTITKNSSSSPSSFALDLAPADDIFFHGHLLPLQLLSHPPISPRPSADSILSENLALPTSTVPNHHHQQRPNESKKKSSNSLLSSFFGLNKQWFRQTSDEDSANTGKKKSKKKGFDVKHFLKKYASIVEPLFSSSSKANKDKRDDLRRRPYSFSGNSYANKERDKWMQRRAEFSAPASMRTSPTNSGLLLSAPGAYLSNESSMDELQNAIQAAIAHCKNSTATKERQAEV